MYAIGFRVSPTKIFYSIIQKTNTNTNTNTEFISIASLNIPISIDLPCKLNFIRNTISTILIQYEISVAGIKLIEGNARSSVNNNLIFRFNVEGVIMELFANSAVKAYFLGVTSNIASVLKVEKCKPPEMLDKIMNLTGVKTDDNKTLSSENKESMIVALAAIERELLHG